MARATARSQRKPCNLLTAALGRATVARSVRRRIWKGSNKVSTQARPDLKKALSALSTCSGSEAGDESSDCVPSTDVDMIRSTSVLGQIRAVVINLDRRPDRMEACANSCAIHCPWLQYSRLPAADGKKEDIPTSEVGVSWHTGANCAYQKIRSIRKGWDDLDHYVPRELKLSAGERGCSMSHIRAWRHCLSLDAPLMVLEDDAMLMPEFTPVLSRALSALPADAQLLYLGYSQAAPWRAELSAELVESEYVWTTVGYIIWPSGAQLLLSQLPVCQPVDNWMASYSANGHLKAYAVRPKIVRQADEWNVMSDVAHSDELEPFAIQAAIGTTADGRFFLSHDTHHSVDLWSQAGVNQGWRISKVANDLYTIQTRKSTQGGRVYLSHDTHYRVDLWCEAGVNQQWVIKNVDTDTYTIQAYAPTSEGKSYLGSNGRHGVELFADCGAHLWRIPASAFEC